MLPNRGGARGRSRGRGGGLRGAASGTNGSRARNDTRKVHFDAQDESSTPPAAPRGRSNDSQKVTRVLSREPGRVHAALSKTFNDNNKSRSSSPSTQAGKGSYHQRYQALKENREGERAHAIANGFLADPEKPRTLAEAITPVGTCQDMCAEFERLERITQSDVWGPETEPNSNRVADESRMVKKFRRAAAGIDEQLPSDLRPPPILQKTLDYLFNDVIGQSSELATVHHFVWDRTRAIRNDFSIQQVSKLADLRITIDSYERIARFHILSLHQLAVPKKPYDKYDSQQEREQLDKTLLSLMQLYDDSRGRLDSPNEAEFRSYCIIFQIQDPVPDLEDRVQAWPRHIFRNARVQRALKLYAAASNTYDDQGPLKPRTPHPIAQENWRRFWQIVKSNEISYLMACVAEIYFNLVRRTTLNSIWQAYRLGQNKRTEDWTIPELSQALALEDEEEVRDFCGNYGFAIAERVDGVPFIDLNSVGGKKLPYPASGTQAQSRSALVECKRHHRTLPAIINGLSVQASRDAGLIDGSSMQDVMEEDRHQNDSLFIRDDEDEPENTTFRKKGKQRESSQASLNPDASSFTPGKTSTGLQKFSNFNASSSDAGKPSTATDFNGTGTSGNPFSAPANPLKPLPSSFSPSVSQSAPPAASEIFSPKAPPTTQSPLPISFNPFGGFQTPKTIPQAATPQTSTGSSLTNIPTPASPFGGLPLFPTKTSNTSLNTTSFPQQTPGLTKPSDAPSTSQTTNSQAFPPVQSTQLNMGAGISAPQASNSQKPIPVSGLFQWSTAPSTFSQNSSSTSSTPFTPFGPATPGNMEISAPNAPPLFPSNLSQSPFGASTLGWIPTSDKPNAELPKGPTFNFEQPSSTPINPTTSTAPFTQVPAISGSTTSSLLPPSRSLFPPGNPQTSHPFAPAASTPQVSAAKPSIPQTVSTTSAAAVAASKARSSAVMNDYARTLVEEKYGFFEQFLEVTTMPMIRAAREQIETDQDCQDADDFRYDTLINRYGRRWRDISYDRRVMRQGRERRRRHAQEIEARAKQAKESSILSQLDAFKEKMASSCATTVSSPATQRHSNYHANQGESGRTRGRSGSRSPPRERPHPTLQPPRTEQGAGSSMKTPSTGVPTSSGYLPGASQYQSSTSSLGSSWGSLKASARRSDTTRSTYFKLKAMGLDPTSDTLFSSTATLRKRSQSDDFESASTSAKKAMYEQDKLAELPSNVSQSLPKHFVTAIADEAEELFAQSRAIREQLSEGITFYREEIKKYESTPPKSDEPPSHSHSLLSSITKQDWYRASTASLSSSRPKMPPPSYRDRVSKFLPRERYADVLKQQNRSVLGRSWPRPRPSTLPSAGLPNQRSTSPIRAPPVVADYDISPMIFSPDRNVIPAKPNLSHVGYSTERVEASDGYQGRHSPTTSYSNGRRLSFEDNSQQHEPGHIYRNSSMDSVDGHENGATGGVEDNISHNTTQHTNGNHTNPPTEDADDDQEDAIHQPRTQPTYSNHSETSPSDPADARSPNYNGPQQRAPHQPATNNPFGLLAESSASVSASGDEDEEDGVDDEEEEDEEREEEEEEDDGENEPIRDYRHSNTRRDYPSEDEGGSEGDVGFSDEYDEDGVDGTGGGDGDGDAGSGEEDDEEEDEEDEDGNKNDDDDDDGGGEDNEQLQSSQWGSKSGASVEDAIEL